jgi:hypothetical protein
MLEDDKTDYPHLVSEHFGNLETNKSDKATPNIYVDERLSQVGAIVKKDGGNLFPEEGGIVPFQSVDIALPIGQERFIKIQGMNARGSSKEKAGNDHLAVQYVELGNDNVAIALNVVDGLGTASPNSGRIVIDEIKEVTEKHLIASQTDATGYTPLANNILSRIFRDTAQNIPQMDFSFKYDPHSGIKDNVRAANCEVIIVVNKSKGEVLQILGHNTGDTVAGVIPAVPNFEDDPIELMARANRGGVVSWIENTDTLSNLPRERATADIEIDDLPLNDTLYIRTDGLGETRSSKVLERIKYLAADLVKHDLYSADSITTLINSTYNGDDSSAFKVWIEDPKAPGAAEKMLRAKINS